MLKKILSKYWKDIALAMAIFIAVTTWMQKDMLEQDQAVRNFSLPSLMGEQTNIFMPKTRTLVYFFAPWCSVCKVSIGNLSSVQNKINTVAVALDYDKVSDVQAFVNDVNISVPVLLGNANVSKAFNISGYPSYYVIDETGKVIGRSMGYSSLAGLLWRTTSLSSNNEQQEKVL